MDSIKALVEVFPIQPPEKGLDHDISKWPRKPSFTCILHTNLDMISDDGSILTVRLETSEGELIARSYLSPSSQLRPCPNSITKWALWIQNGPLKVLLGLSFVNRGDSVDFSFITQTFVRKFAERQVQHVMSFSSRSLKRRGTPVQSLSESVESDLFSDSQDEFGDFQS